MAVRKANNDLLPIMEQTAAPTTGNGATTCTTRKVQRRVTRLGHGI